MSSKVWVMCNASPVIGLLSIHKVFLLWQLFGEVILPEAVYQELCADSLRHGAEVEKINQYDIDGKFKNYKVKNANIVKSMYGKLHYGELEVIVGAKELGISLAIIDEIAAIKMAKEFLVDTIGTLGILTLAKKKGMIDKVKPDLDHLRENGYRILGKLYQQILVDNGKI